MTERARWVDALAAQHIGTQVHYIPVNALPYYRSLGFDPKDTPVTLRLISIRLASPSTQA
jgi:dTDP-4-amino-4,6-dideoxygalactose transaminase